MYLYVWIEDYGRIRTLYSADELWYRMILNRVIDTMLALFIYLILFSLHSLSPSQYPLFTLNSASPSLHLV